MSFITSVNNQIEKLKELKFQKNNPVEIRTINENLSFIRELGNSIYSEKLFCKTPTSRFYELKKTSETSLENSIHPEFVLSLKKAAHLYIKTLTSDWENCSEEELIEILPKFNLSIGYTAVKKKSKEVNLLKQIIRNYSFGLSETVIIREWMDNIYVFGIEKNIKLFSGLMERESGIKKLRNGKKD